MPTSQVNANAETANVDVLGNFTWTEVAGATGYTVSYTVGSQSPVSFTASKVLGIFVSFNQIGYALGAPIINLFYDFTGSYQTSLLICIGIMLAVVTLLQYVITCAHKEKIRIEKDVIKE